MNGLNDAMRKWRQHPVCTPSHRPFTCCDAGQDFIRQMPCPGGFSATSSNCSQILRMQLLSESAAVSCENSLFLKVQPSPPKKIRAANFFQQFAVLFV